MKEKPLANIQKRPASQVMRDTFRYYEGSRILRELGFHGCGNYWSRRGEKRLTVPYNQTFESALRDPRAHRRMLTLYWNKAAGQVRRAMKRMGEAFRRLAESPQIKAAMKVFSEYAENQEQIERDEAWTEIADAHERRALLGEAMEGIEGGREEAEFAEARRRYVRRMVERGVWDEAWTL